jgi:hypothetical protein
MSSNPLKTSKLSLSAITPEQNAAINRLYESNCLLIARKGFGKAMVGQVAIQDLLDDGHITRALVVAPLKVCQMTWGTEWQKWDHLEPVGLALGTAEQRKAVIEGGARIVVINIENLGWLLGTYGHDHGFDGLLVDELSKFKAAGGGTMKVLRKHLKDFTWRAGMSASPVAEAGVDIYSQAMVVDGGAALGRNKEAFLRNYFYPTDFQQRKWALLPGAAARLAGALKDIVFVADDQGYEDGLPELIDEVVRVELPPGARQEYELMRKEGYIDGVEAVNQAVLTGKLQQITAGAVYLAGGERWIHWAKFDALRRVLAAAAGPVIVSYWFQFEQDELRAQYPDMVFLGDNDPKVVTLWNSGAIRLLGVHPKSAGHGLNLQYGGHELVCLTVPWGADPWSQLVGRIRRRGQVSPVVKRTTIVAADTVDELVLARHVDKSFDEGSLMAHIKGA